MDKKTLRSVDLMLCILFLVLSAAIAKWSIDILLANTDARFYISAGFLPLIAALIFAAINIRILLVAKREGGTLDIFKPSSVRRFITGKKGLRAIFILGWMGVYLFVTLRRLPYPVSTFIFLVVFISAFYQKSIVKALVISAVTSGTVAFLFGSVAKIPLP
ncbi:MAG: tripartite tricarboxylate transporter TctB family protein [Planctomycetota bacterium]|jgi:hypothetical protein|nr:tripartite tricarboxylate transporter TctB family protein [Planctomycetota bacterium]